MWEYGAINLFKKILNNHLSKFFLKTLIATIIIIYISTLLDFHLLWQGAQKISSKNLVLATICCLLSSLCQTARWCYLTRNQLSDSNLQQMLLYWRANFFNLITPASLGGDIYRVTLSKKNKKGTIAFGFIVKERFIGLLGIFLSYLLFLSTYLVRSPHKISLPHFFTVAALFCILGSIALLVLQHSLSFLARSNSPYLARRWKKKIIQFSKAVHYKSLFDFFILLLFSLFSTTAWMLVFYLLACTLSWASLVSSLK